MPTTRTTSIEVFKFDELSDSAKERARDWWREGMQGDNYFAESVIEDAAEIAALFGLNICQTPVKLMGGGTRLEPTVYWSGFSSQGDGASFEGSYSYRKGALAAVRDHTGNIDAELLRIVQALQDAQATAFYSLAAHCRQSGRYSHEMSMSIDVENTLDRDVTDDQSEAITEAMRDFARWIYRRLESEFEYVNGNEQVDESIRINEYEFDESGARV